MSDVRNDTTEAQVAGGRHRGGAAQTEDTGAPSQGRHRRQTDPAEEHATR